MGVWQKTSPRTTSQSQGARDTSALFNSMDHTVDEEEQTAYIGSTLKNPAYGIYVEYGTGIYYEGERRTSWIYQDREKRNPTPWE